MTVEGKVLSMQINTAGVLSGIQSEAAQSLGLNALRMAPDMTLREFFSGNVVDHYTVAHDVDLGGLKARSFPFAIFSGDISLKGRDGMIAPDVLSKYEVEFDFANGKFNLFSRDHCEGKMVYWTREPYAAIDFTIESRSGHIVFPVTLDGHRLAAVLDTSSMRSVLGLEAAQRTFSIGESSPGFESRPSEGSVPEWRYPFKTLTLDGVTVNNPDLHLISNTENRIASFDTPRLIIGMGVLRQLHLFISYHEKRLYVTPASAH